MYLILNMLKQYAIINAIEKITSHPNRSFSVREFAKFSNLSPAMAGRALEYMKNEGIVTLKQIGRTYQYKADLSSPLCRHWKILINLQKISASGLAEKAKKTMPDIFSILVYGSMARGTNDEKSDVDLLIISHSPQKLPPDFLGALGGDVNISLLSLLQWKKKAGEDKVFYDNVIYDSIVLYGEKPVIF